MTVAAGNLFQDSMGTFLPQGQAVDYALYDTLTYTSGTTVKLEFFKTVKTSKVDSNMEHAGAIPHPNYFQIKSIRVIPLVAPAIAADHPLASKDVYLLMSQSYCELLVGHKIYGTWPTLLFPGGVGVWASESAAGAEADNLHSVNAAHGFPSTEAIYKFENPLQIPPQASFRFDIVWDSAQTLSGNQKIKVVFHGVLIRPAQ